MHIYESAENYLETILVLSIRSGQVRSIDIANELSFSKPSVSVAMKNLRTGGYITMNKDGMISLTEKGREIAERIYAADPVAHHTRGRPGNRGGRCMPHRACHQRRHLCGDQGARKQRYIRKINIPLNAKSEVFRGISLPSRRYFASSG